MHKNNESGRSMVEMLGVLAIIGVLSVGGIAGYRTAMDRHKANEFFDLWHKADVERTAQIATNPNKVKVKLSKGDIEILYDQWSYKNGAQTNTEIMIKNMNKNVCKMIKDAKLEYWGTPEGVDGSNCSLAAMDEINGVYVGADKYPDYFSVCLNQEGNFSYRLQYLYNCYWGQ